MLVRQHIYLSKFCINKLFNLCLGYLLGRLWYPRVGGRKGVAPLCGLSEYVLSIKVWCSRSSQNKVWALAIRSLYELNLRHRRNYTLVKCKVCETAPKSLVWAPTLYQNLSTRHDWPVQKVMFDFPSRLQGTQNALPIICESVGAQNKYIGAASQALDLLKSCFRSVCLLVPTSSLAFPRFAFGAHAVDLHRSLSLVGGHAVDLWQVYAGYSIPGKKGIY